MPNLIRRILSPLALLAIVALVPLPDLSAAPVPSKTQPGQSLAQRDQDLAGMRDFLARDEVARALASRGLTAGQVEDRLARLSDDDLRRLAGNLDQVQAAGALTQNQWILVYILAGVLLIVLLV